MSHPIEERPDLPPERRLQLLEIYHAQIWDQLWWISLPWYKRLGWWLRGFRAPIKNFYSD